MKSLKLLVSLLCLICVFGADALPAHARMLEDWEIGISRQTPQEQKERFRAEYLHYKNEADSLYIGEWVNTRTGTPLSITAEYWGEEQYTYRSTSFDCGNWNKRTILMELEGHKLTVYFDISKPNEFTTYNPAYKITAHYKRKQ